MGARDVGCGSPSGCGGPDEPGRPRAVPPVRARRGHGGEPVRREAHHAQARVETLGLPLAATPSDARGLGVAVAARGDPGVTQADCIATSRIGAPCTASPQQLSGQGQMVKVG